MNGIIFFIIGITMIVILQLSGGLPQRIKEGLETNKQKKIKNTIKQLEKELNNTQDDEKSIKKKGSKLGEEEK